MNDKAISTALSYVLLLGITVFLMGGLSLAAGELLETQHEQVVEEELDVVSQRLAADISTADRLVQGGGTTETASVTSPLPRTVSDGHYTVRLEQDGDDVRIVLESAQVDVVRETTVSPTTPVAEDQFVGGTVEITYDSGHLVIDDD